jgi:hypothetical protein
VDRVERMHNFFRGERNGGMPVFHRARNRQRAILLRGGGDRIRHDAVRRAEAQALPAHQRIGEFGHGQKIRARALGQTSAIHVRGSDRPGQQTRRPQRVGEHREHQRLQIVLAIVDVAKRSVVRAHQHRLRFAQSPAGENPRMLQRHRIALLRHDAGALHVTIAQPQKSELARRPQQQVLRELSQVHHRYRHRRSCFRQVINGGDRTVGVFRQTLESQQPGRFVAVDRKPRRRDGRRPHRAYVHSCKGGLEPRDVPPQKLDRREQIVGQRGRLGRLRMRVRRHDGFPMPFGEFEKHPAQIR